PSQVRTQCLDRDDSVQPQVLGTVDLGHAAAPDDAIELVAATEQPRLSHVECTFPRTSTPTATVFPRRPEAPPAGPDWERTPRPAVEMWSVAFRRSSDWAAGWWPSP